ncbi:hypothetical protein AAG570_007176 [Ranatra chinensis]|uniref:C2H2-type domain-containing protein n=1 Tax=Ranatra chinensis TaxID=642074 RepID=A0ABD0YIX6_9HEMI
MIDTLPTLDMIVCRVLQGNFAVPSPGRTGPGSASLVKLPTTAPIVNSMSRRVPQPMVAPPPHSRGPAPGRPSNRSRVTCQVCDKIFASPEALTIHMHTHRQGAQQPPPQGGSPMRSASKLPYE